MKIITKISLCLILIFISMDTFSQTKLNHLAIYVKDLTESTDFYKDIIGLEEIDEPFKDGLHTWLQIGDSESAVHLIERTDPWTNPTIDKTNHLCFSVKDITAFIDKLNKNNIVFEDWEGKEGEINLRPDGIQQIYLRDPSGYWLEINDDY